MAAVEQERQQTARAQAKYVRSSARKARLVTDLIRGRTVPEARTILAFSQRAVARDIEKVLRSAVANAESRPDLRWNGDDLVIARAHADEGRTLKRARARARGRVASIRKRTCHITIELTPLAVAADAATRRAPRSGAHIAETSTPTVADPSTGEPATDEPAATVAEPLPGETAGEPTQAVQEEPPADTSAGLVQEPAPEQDEGEEE